MVKLRNSNSIHVRSAVGLTAAVKLFDDNAWTNTKRYANPQAKEKVAPVAYSSSVLTSWSDSMYRSRLYAA